ncbi:MAG: class I SAM-dependent methyltransferase [Eubacteriales bacterium]
MLWIATDWQDYQLIDCGKGEKLERWNKEILIRPDPQAVWQTPRTHKSWKSYTGRYQRSSTGGGHWEKHNMAERWTIQYKDLTFHLKPMNFKHTGIFPEQASNWDFAQKQIKNANRPISVLNLFAYTGAASVACAVAGAKVCHVDAAKGMVSWAKENAKASGVEEAPIRWIVDDCVKFVEREIRRGKSYDAIILDPPSYGRGPSGELWRMEENLFPFVELISNLLSDKPLFIILNSYTTGLAPSVLTYILETVISKKIGGKTESRELGLPVTESGLVLPCGATGRWTAQ